MKNIINLIYIIAVFGLFYFISSFFMGKDIKEQVDYISEFKGATLEDLQELQKDDDSLQLALIDINIVQGDEGKKLWELTAEWAAYTDSSGDLQAREPRINYWNSATDDENKVFKARGKIGRVLENNTLITLNEDVLLEQDTLFIESPYLEFTSQNEIFTLEDGAVLTSPSSKGRADTLIWNTIDNIIQAQDNVVFIFNYDSASYTLDTPAAVYPEE